MKPKFIPEQVLFSLTTKCNLACKHCTVKPGSDTINLKTASKFLRQCTEYEIIKVGFTGGEPFLALRELLALTRTARKYDMEFDRITTNGVWWHTSDELTHELTELHTAGYDGTFGLSCDRFHRQDIRKLAKFITGCNRVWERIDQVSLVFIEDKVKALQTKTYKKLRALARVLHAKMEYHREMPVVIRADNLLLRISSIPLFPINNKKVLLSTPWDAKKWFHEDYCAGPGNIFFVTPTGDVYPCCGYATDFCNDLRLGNVQRDTPGKLARNAHTNKFVNTVFTQGLTSIKNKLVREGVIFPGKTYNHCFFCYYARTYC
ncbi:MAG: 4Fe-4S cluster-binding domain-containing protein [Elusimicrobiota bacterium]